MKTNFSIRTILLIAVLVFISINIHAQNELLRTEIQRIINSANGTVGVAIKNLDTKDTLSFNNNLHYPMQSVYKFPLAISILDWMAKEELLLNQVIRISKNDLLPNTWSPLRDKYPNGNVDIPLSELISYTVSQSDNNGCDILFRLQGSPKAVEKYIHSLGVTSIAIVGTEEEMHKDSTVQYKNWAKPSALVEILELFYKKKILSKSNTNYLWKLMVETTTGPKRIKGLLPSETIVAHKTGSSGKSKSGISAAVNDVGIIKLPNGQNIAIAVFITNAKADDEVSENVIARISKATYDYYSKSAKK